MVTIRSPSHVCLSPEVFLGSYDALCDNDFRQNTNLKVIVNCGNTASFLKFLDQQQPILPSDVAVLNFDLGILSELVAFNEFHSRFNRILQHYLAFFYRHNRNIHYYINSNLGDSSLSLKSPTINGNPLKLLFSLNRLLKLMRNVNNSAGIILVSEKFDEAHPSNSLVHALAILCLMDTYGYNFDASCHILNIKLSSVFHERYNALLFNRQHYDDVLLIDSLKKFFLENQKIKQADEKILTQNSTLKRSCDHFDAVSITLRIRKIA